MITERPQATSIEQMPLDWIDCSELNPRRHFDPETLQELADSIRTHGLLEALVVREVFRDNAETPRYIIIAGERRYRAAKLAGLESVPVRVLHGIDEKTHIALALVENLQRQDLDPLEEAAGYAALSSIGYTQSAIAAAVHRSQPAVAKAVALLELPASVQALIRSGSVSATHGVALGRYRAFPRVAEHIAACVAKDNLSVQAIEKEIPDVYALQSRRVLKILGHVYDACKSCPYGAFRRVGYNNVCLKPEHYGELESQEREKRRGELATLVDTLGGVTPKLADLDHRTIGRFYAGQQPPVGCTEDCACRLRAVGYTGEIEYVCTDPARLALLREEETKTRALEVRLAGERDLGRLGERLATLWDVGPREMTLVVHEALRGVPGPVLRSVVERRAPLLFSPKLERLSLEQIATLTPLEMLTLTVDALIREDIEHQAKWTHNADINYPRRHWYLDGISAGSARDLVDEDLRCLECGKISDSLRDDGICSVCDGAETAD